MLGKRVKMLKFFYKKIFENAFWKLKFERRVGCKTPGPKKQKICLFLGSDPVPLPV